MTTSKRAPLLIGLCGKAGAGKDTAADYLCEHHGFTRYAFADPIKDLLNARFGWRKEDWSDREWKERKSNQCGYTLASAPIVSTLNMYHSPRSWAQWLGTEVGRTLDPDCWVRLAQRFWHNQLINHYDPVRLVITDVRFDNEYQWIKMQGGSILRIERTSVDILDSTHVSERAIRRFEPSDIRIDNNGTISELHRQLATLMEIIV